MKAHNPFLYFNFKQTNKSLTALHFKDPLTIITTDKLDDVVSCLTRMQNYVQEGYYAAGYLTYEAAPAFNDTLPVKKNQQMPLLWFGIFTEPTYGTLDREEPFHVTAWEPMVSIAAYYEAIEKIHQAIEAQRTEQVNYTMRFRSQFSGDAFSFYKQMEEAQAANYTAYIKTSDYTILSASPELFFELSDGVIRLKPMKGTVERGKTYAEDIENAHWLQTSEKNRAENKIITTLVQQELAKLAEPGTVEVTRKFELEKYPTLYQMTSSVQATLAPEVNLVDIFKTLFPSGSITGLPKRETMEVIEALETTPRELYCGAIGYVTPQHEAIFNVPIRTVLLNNKTQALEYGAGGGITLASTKEEEYEEVLTKAKLLARKRTPFQLLETVAIKQGEFIVLEHHLKRLAQSAAYFDFKLDEHELRSTLTALAAAHPRGEWKIRLLLDRTGVVTTEIERLLPAPALPRVVIAQEPINKDDHFLYHKTTHRSLYDTHRRAAPDAYDVLLWNQAKEATEFTIGNLVIDLNGELITPPLTSGLLPGTFRQSLLDEGTISERTVLLDDVKAATKIWLINSVREWVRVSLQ